MTGLESFVISHQFLSYLFVFVGMLLEADLTFLVAAIFTTNGLLKWEILIPLAFFNLIFGDVLWYYIGLLSCESRLGNWLKRRFRKYDEWFDDNFISRYAQLIFFAKFIYYINRLAPFLAGWHKMEFKRFFRIHFYAATFWTTIMTIIGIGFGAFISLVGVKWVLKRIWLLFLVLAIIFIGGDHILKKVFSKKIGRRL